MKNDGPTYILIGENMKVSGKNAKSINIIIAVTLIYLIAS